MHRGPRVIPNWQHVTLAALSFTALAIYGSLVPLQYQPLGLTEALTRFRAIPLLQLGVDSRADWVANILLFVPIGFLILGACSMDRPKWHSLLLAAIVVPICAVLSVVLEFTQLWFPNRTVSQNDIIAETIGAIVGAGLWTVIGQTCLDKLRCFAADLRPKKQIDWLLQLYLLGFLIHALLPLDLTVSFSEIYRKFRDGRILLIPFSHHYDSSFSLVYQLVTDAIVFIPIGAWIATAFTHTDHKIRSLGSCTLMGVGLAATIEFAQVLVYTRFVDTTDILTGTVGVTAGAWLTRRWFAEEISRAGVDVGRWRGVWTAAVWLGAAILYAATVIAIFWSPFEFVWDADMARQRWAEFFRAPFTALYAGSEFHATQEVLRKLLFFAPLGALLAQAIAHVAERRLRRCFLAVLFAGSVALAMGIELGQLFLPSHSADFTDVLLCAVGAALGMMLRGQIRKGEIHSYDQPIAQRLVVRERGLKR